MSCEQVNQEFSLDKFRFIHPHPSVFCVWRYTCFAPGRSYYVYRVLFASLLVLLVLLDFFWIIGFAGAGDDNRASACLDSVQITLVLLTLVYCLLPCMVNKWIRVHHDEGGEYTIPYRFVWFLYTLSINSVFVGMIIFWVSNGASSTMEQQLKNCIPAFLILFDLCLNSFPLYLCHCLYIGLVYWIYLTVAAVILLVCYLCGVLDQSLSYPSNPTVWIGGYALFPNGFSDFYNVHRILTTLLGAAAIAIMMHCVLLSIVIARDFLATLCNRSTDRWIGGDLYWDSTEDLDRNRHSSVTNTSVNSTTPQEQQQRVLNLKSGSDNAAYDSASDSRS